MIHDREAPVLRVRGAREHNLKNVSVTLPRDQLVVITGLSGSGKSSLAFDTIYAEGQRRYVESLSAYARQFLEMMHKPDVDSIEGLSPAISIEQKTTSRNPRSTVGTVTEIYDYMRLLWARIGVPYSPATGEPISAQTVSQMVDRIMAMAEGTRLYLLAPIARGRKGEFKKELAELQRAGFQRVKVDGQMYEVEDVPALKKNFKHDIEVVVDRLVVREDIASRLADSLETALERADGIALVEDASTGDQTTFSAKFACPVSGFTIAEIEPRLFSFNNPAGACPACDGLGVQMFISPDLVVPHELLSLDDGAILPWSRTSTPSPYYKQTLKGLADHYGFDMNTAFRELDPEAQKAVLYGSGRDSVRMTYEDGMRKYQVTKPFEGVIPNLERRLRETESNWVREELSKFQAEKPCGTCHGERLKPEALAVKVGPREWATSISTVSEMSVSDARDWFLKLDAALTDKDKEIGERILKEINDRLGFLNSVGLDYLNLSRTSGTLSGGESQRIRLASQIGSGLTGVLYVLDEPSIGLHQRDNARLLETLVRLRDLGNTVIVVEHDEEAIRAADYLVDMGPRAGVHGGHVVAEGTPEEVMRSEDSITAAYLNGTLEIAVPSSRRQGSGKTLELRGAAAHNLHDVDLTIPLGTFVAITGVSGGGKSTLIVETLYKAIARSLTNAREIPGEYQSLDGLHHIDKVIDIDQSPIGRTPRSNPATYTGAFTPIRDWFAGLPEAKIRGYKPGRFSFNVKGGRCEACHGDGVIKIEMHFLPDIFVECDVCKGKRYNRETLEVKFKNHSIAEVLALTVDEAADLFTAVPSIRDKMVTLQRVGLGYVKVGQSATTLSGGEAQRVKLAKELSRRATGKTLYILDEPTTGLHFEDVRKLLEVLHTLVETGNTVLVIEHNLDVIKTADWIVDLGPEGGSGGGRIVACGTPEDVAQVQESYTGQYLAPYLVARKVKVA
jgi:excinuclease ABC subunit A